MSWRVLPRCGVRGCGRTATFLWEGGEPWPEEPPYAYCLRHFYVYEARDRLVGRAS